MELDFTLPRGNGKTKSKQEKSNTLSKVWPGFYFNFVNFISIILIKFLEFVLVL